MVTIWARLFIPSLDYYPPDRLVDDLERSWFVAAGVRDLAFFGYVVVALTMMNVFFGLIGSVGVLAGIVAYEWTAGDGRPD